MSLQVGNIMLQLYLKLGLRKPKDESSGCSMSISFSSLSHKEHGKVQGREMAIELVF
jgi:hypothetical protein